MDIQFDPSKPMKFRDNRKWTIHRLVGYMENGEAVFDVSNNHSNHFPIVRNANGLAYPPPCKPGKWSESVDDIINCPPVEWWINISATRQVYFHPTREQADISAWYDRIGCIHFIEGEGL
jgi:hypothetical protein